MEKDSLQFDFQPEHRSIIKVIGVGGGGSNAVNHMFRQGIQGVDFVVCNTDYQDLQKSPVNNKIQLGQALTRGLGAGSIPDKGRESALETIDEIRRQLNDGTQMVFITAGLGGGTGTGAAPVIASVARELGILTVAIVTIPFTMEGKKRRAQAEEGLEELKKYVDTLLVIGNDKLREIYGNLKMSEAFTHADNVLLGAAKSIAEIISINLHVNVDFNDVKTVMKDSGVAIMGSASASGEHRALRAVENALNSPLLNDNDIKGARHVLLNIMSGSDDITMDEFGEITDYIQEESGYTAELITGYGIDPSLGDQVSVTIIATGFKAKDTGFEPAKESGKVVSQLTEEIAVPLVQSQIVTEVPKKTEEPFIIVKGETQSPTETVQEQSSIESVKEASSSDESGMFLKVTPVAEEQKEIEILPVFEENIESVEETQEFIITSASENEVTSEVQEPKKQDSKFNETVKHYLNEGSPENSEDLHREDRIKLAQERIKKLKELSLKIKTPEGLAQMEKEPTFRRKNTQLDDTNYSKDSNISRYTLSDGDGKTEIRPNNSFLHDNVD